jgi:hypothetical protein
MTRPWIFSPLATDVSGIDKLQVYPFLTRSLATGISSQYFYRVFEVHFLFLIMKTFSSALILFPRIQQWTYVVNQFHGAMSYGEGQSLWST